MSGGTSQCFEPNDALVVVLSMCCLGTQTVNAYQAFVEFDPAVMAFDHGTYTASPFGLHIPLSVDGNTIILSAGCDPLAGQQPTSEDADLAVLTFRAAAVGTAVVGFVVPHDPPTQLSDAYGSPVIPTLVPTGPISVQASCCTLKGDMNCDGAVTFADIDLFVEALNGESAWTHACPWLNADCSGDSNVTFADIDPFVAVIGTTCP